MIRLDFTEEQVVEIANHTVFTAYHAIEDDDDESWRVARIACAILDKIEAVLPTLAEHSHFYAAEEMTMLRRKVAGGLSQPNVTLH